MHTYDQFQSMDELFMYIMKKYGDKKYFSQKISTFENWQRSPNMDLDQIVEELKKVQLECNKAIKEAPLEDGVQEMKDITDQMVVSKIYASLSDEEYKKLKDKLDVKDINNIDMIEEKLNIISIDEINWRTMRQQSAVEKGINMHQLDRKQGQINYSNNRNFDYELKKKMKRIRERCFMTS